MGRWARVLAACGVVAASVVSGVVPATAATHHTVAPNHPHEVVVLGDSTAMTLEVALAATAPTGVSVIDGSNFGCGLAIAQGVSADPPNGLFPMFPACNVATPVDQQWPALDTAAVATTQPGDLVFFVAGKWENNDIEMDGVWTNITEKGFQHYELGQLETLARLATAHGAHLELATMPAMIPGADANGLTPAQEKKRRLLYDGLLKATAKQFPTTVSVVNYGRILTPKGVYREYAGGVQIRTSDGIHTPAYVPGNPFSGNSTQAVADAFYAWIGPKIWPMLLNSHPAGAPRTSARHATTS